MEKKTNYLLIVIILLVLIIILLVGFILFFIEEFKEEREEIKELYSYNDGSTKIANNNTNNNNINVDDKLAYGDNLNITNNNNYISKEDALKTALEDAKINQNDIYDTNVELDYKYNQTVYEVDFNYQQFEYEYYINAETANIVKSFRERN